MKKSLQYYSIAFAFTISSFTGYKLLSGPEDNANQLALAENTAVNANDTCTDQVDMPATAVSKAEKKRLAAEARRSEKKLAAAAKAEARKKKIAAVKEQVAQSTGKRFHKASGMAHELVNFGLDKIGSPYVWGGTSENGFDCSGFITYVYSAFEVEVPRSSSELALAGSGVPRNHAKPGDILIFTGTNPKQRTPGHVGIVISNPGEALEFVHASSNGGVKISQVENTNYERRFLEVRRVL